jgi:hypothetical protein
MEKMNASTGKQGEGAYPYGYYYAPPHPPPIETISRPIVGHRMWEALKVAAKTIARLYKPKSSADLA